MCDDPVRHRQFALSEAAHALLPRFADWSEPSADRDSAGAPDARLVAQLLAANVLVEEGSREHEFEERLGPWGDWGTASRYFHLASRTHSGAEFASAAEDTAWLLQTLPDRPQPAPFKEYPAVPRTQLPPATGADPAALGLEAVLRRRRTTRRFEPGALVSRQELATLLRWVAGPLHTVEPKGLQQQLLKASPSAGALHTLEVYPVVLGVEGVAPGIYHYHPTAHALEAVAPGREVDREELVHWCGGQTYVGQAGVVLFYTAMLERTAWKYRTGRTYRTLFMELGHFSQTAYLVGTALNLGVFFTAATRDAAVEEALGLDWTSEILVGLNGVGVPAVDERERQDRMLHGGPADFSFAQDAWDGRGA
ncbi:SagB family peptide dehydrogenase [Kitasatospora sp. MMS16-BH015]|uniref:SagB family peptide dehydrogenase n=1 Tax=Kitasatospora sp. MMS16-BH015 TaxID=2018025 RepID=UPI00131A5FA5|nr:SagB family peptide dehydrogenase [Kitasatospora sp. MMS16-BH015]